MLKLTLKTVVNAACEIIKLGTEVRHYSAHLGESDPHDLQPDSALQQYSTATANKILVETRGQM